MLQTPFRSQHPEVGGERNFVRSVNIFSSDVVVVIWCGGFEARGIWHR